ncbi:MAG: hypothetical protein WCW33_06345 [Candidatus Babeliales bacterium]|jgi:hypothetical protein
MKKQNHMLRNSVVLLLSSLGFFTKCGPAIPAHAAAKQPSADIHEIMKTENFRQGVHEVQQKFARNARMNGSKKAVVTDNDFKQSKAFQAAVKELQEKISEPVFEQKFIPASHLLNIVQINLTNGEIDKAYRNITRYSQQFETLLHMHGESDQQIQLLRKKAGRILAKCGIDKYAPFIEILDRRNPERASKIGLLRIDWNPYISNAINNLTDVQQAMDKSTGIIEKIVLLPQEQQLNLLYSLEAKILILNKGGKTYEGLDISLEIKYQFCLSKIDFWERQFDDQESEVYKHVEPYSQFFDDLKAVCSFTDSIHSHILTLGKSILSMTGQQARDTYLSIQQAMDIYQKLSPRLAGLREKAIAGLAKIKKSEETPTHEQEEEQESPREGVSDETERLKRVAQEREDYQKRMLAQTHVEEAISKLQEILSTFAAAEKGTFTPDTAKRLLSAASKKSYEETIAQADRELRDAVSFFTPREFKDKLANIALLKTQIQQAQERLNALLKEHAKKASTLQKPKAITPPASPTLPQASPAHPKTSLDEVD